MTIENLDEKSEDEEGDAIDTKNKKKSKAGERQASDESRTIERSRPSIAGVNKVTVGVDPSLGKKRPSGTEQKPAAKPKDPKENSAQKRTKERQQSNTNSTLSPRNEKEALRAQRDARTSKVNDAS